MLSAIDYLGFAAASCTTASFLPQALKVWRERSAAGISMGMYLIFIVGVALWLCYGLLLRAWPVVAANAVTLLLASAIVVMKWHFERADRGATALRP